MLYGYEAMALVLDTLRRAGDRANERTLRRRARARARRRPRLACSGPYAIEADGRHDAADASAAYRVRGGVPVFERTSARPADRRSAERGGERLVEVRVAEGVAERLSAASGTARWPSVTISAMSP